VRRLLLIFSALLLSWAVLVLATGGIQWKVAGLLFRSRDPSRALALGLGLMLVHAFTFRESFVRDVDRLEAVLRRVLPALALGCALVLIVHALRLGSFAAGGADPYGYLSQAYGWAGGTLPHAQPLPISLPWPSGDSSLAPLGYRPGPQPHTIVPSYAPGLPLMMAATLIFGACGPFMVVPACGALAVWLTFRLGRRTGGPWAGILAAIFVATSPIVLFQALWPMSDVPAAALWTGATLAALRGGRRGALVTGLWTAAGLLVRPNLPIVPLVLLVHVVLSSRSLPRRSADLSTEARSAKAEGAKAGWIHAGLFLAAVAPVAVAIAALNTAWYGAPWHSGYGAAAEIYAAGSVIPNLARYPVWLWQSQSPLILLALVPFLPRFRGDASAPAVRLCAALFLATLACYLPYFAFEEWWYLRFLLPAVPAVLVLLSTGIVTLGRRLPRPWGHVAVTAVTLLLLTYTTRFSQEHGMFGPLKEGERRYADVGTYIHQALPPNAVVLSVQESGSVRYYSGRMTIRWDLIDREWTTRAAGEVERLGLHPYLVIEDWEQPQLRGWFGIAPEAPLPWPLVARLREPVGVSVLDMSSKPNTALVPAALVSGSAPLCGAQQPLSIQRP
jgi:hypothetical protein